MAICTPTAKKTKQLDVNYPFKKECESFFFFECKGRDLCINGHEILAIIIVCKVNSHITFLHPEEPALTDDKNKAKFGYLSAQQEEKCAFKTMCFPSAEMASERKSVAS